MLPRVAGKDQPPTVRLNQTYKIKQLLAPNLPSLVYNDHPARRNLSPLQALAHRLRASQPVFDEVENLLTLRREHHGLRFAAVQRPLQTLEHKALSGASAATK